MGSGEGLALSVLSLSLATIVVVVVAVVVAVAVAPCGLRGCKNGPATFPGQMSYKPTKPGLVSVLYLSKFLLCWCLLRPLFMYC